MRFVKPLREDYYLWEGQLWSLIYSHLAELLGESNLIHRSAISLKKKS